MSIADIASGVLLLAGSVFALTGGVGLLRFPDFYTRAHAAGLTDTAGATLFLLGLLLQLPDASTVVRLLLIIAFLLITTPTATQAVTHAALNDGLAPRAERWEQR